MAIQAQESAPPAKSQISASGRVTPMMKQYWQIKNETPSALLFFRMGDFYELFFDDAKQASAALNIALTNRGRHEGKDVPMCGVPVHAADSYIHRLIRSGFRVAVCEQIEDPVEARKRGAKSVVKRDIVRIVTPGTLTEDSLLDARQANHLVSVARVRNDLAVSWIDISTGTFLVQTTDRNSLGTLLDRLEPAEIVLSEQLFEDPELTGAFEPFRERLNPEHGSRFDSSAGTRRLKDFFRVGSLDGFGSFSRCELSAIGGLLAYVELTQKDRIPRLSPPRQQSDDTFMVIDGATRRNLELLQASDGSRKTSLNGVMDRTITGPGARLLTQRLAAPATDIGIINHRLDSIATFIATTASRDELRSALREVPDLERALGRIGIGRCGPRDLGVIRDGLTAAYRIRDILDRIESISGELAAARAGLEMQPTLLEWLNRSLVDNPPVQLKDGGFVRQGYDEELDKRRLLSEDSRRHIAALQKQYQSETGVVSLHIRHNNVLGYYVEVQQAQSNRLDPAIFIHRQTMAHAMRYTTTALGALETEIIDAAGAATRIEQRIFSELTDGILREADSIAKAAAALSVVDVAAGLAQLALDNGYTRPALTQGTEFNVCKGRHPVVEALGDGSMAQGFVANDCILESEQRLWLLTGPNMAGKSTFLRQNALITVMAQAGSYVPAESAKIGIVDRLFSRVGAADDLARGRSTFMVEMIETALILNHATRRSLVILDEIGRGTATFDGLSIAWAVLEALHDINECRALFATHYHELAQLSSRLVSIRPHTMTVREWENEIVFLYQVEPGTAGRSYGIHVARLAGLPDNVVTRAEEVLTNLETGDSATTLSHLIDDLPLFKSAGISKEEPRSEPSRTDTLIDEIQPDELSPRDALDIVYRLKALRNPA